jgi:hypothetical protein
MATRVTTEVIAKGMRLGFLFLNIRPFLIGSRNVRAGILLARHDCCFGPALGKGVRDKLKLGRLRNGLLVLV